MTNPPDNGHNEGDPGPGPGRGEDGYTGGADSHSFPSYPSYPSTPHPEDNPGYGAPGYGPHGAGGPGQGYPGQGYQNYQAYPEFSQGQGQPGQGTGTITVTPAVGWAFRSVFANWPIWILGTLVLMIATVAVSWIMEFTVGGVEPTFGYLAAQLIMAVIYLVATVYIYHGVLQEIDHPKVRIKDFFADVNLWPSFFTMLIVQIFSSLVVMAIALPLMLPLMSLNPEAIPSDAAALEFLGRVIGVIGIIMLAAVLLAPVTSFIAWYAVDRREGIGGAISHGIRDGARNYGKLLVFFLVSFLVIGIASVVTLGLAMVLLGPVLLLAMAHLYRQMSGGRLPAA